MNKPNTEFDVFAAFREDFPALKKWTYMDVAGRGVLSRTTRAALDAHLDDRMMNGGDKDRFFALIERARGRFAQLINAGPDEDHLHQEHFRRPEHGGHRHRPGRPATT